MDWSQVQGLVFSSYKDLKYASFVALRVREGASVAAKAGLGALLPRVTVVGPERADPQAALNLAFTHRGLQALGLPKGLLDGFPREFAEGMEDRERARALGDVDAGAPDTWSWGGEGNRVHVLVLLYAATKPGLASLRATVRDACKAGFDEAYERPCEQLGGDKEHFGFTDGISQPELVEATEKPPADPAAIPFGEFVLGEVNVYGKRVLDPKLPAGDAVRGLPEGSFGRFGTYLVAREMSQDVKAFWSYLDEASKAADGTSRPAEREALAAKMVGRTREGAPLATVAPHAKNPQNAFDFLDDPLGRVCPIGAHIRRVNPRSSLEPNREESERTVRARRILRRGRSFGKPNWTPLAEGNDPEVDRGLVFVCLNANIRRQFEFVQQTWINNVKFGGLYDERDPLVGFPPTDFTIPERPVRRRLEGIPAFTRLRGGGYFFLPGVAALRFLLGAAAGSSEAAAEAGASSG